jgi:hypothetical protein
MKVQLLGGPLDGTTIETPECSIEPEMVHFSESRRVHHYLVGADDAEVFTYLSRDTVIDDRRPFEVWWRGHGADEEAKEAAWEAWQAALSRF